MPLDYFLTLARYNAWANRRIYEACGRLDAEDLARPRPSFFGSILATLNHLQVGDRLWLSRIEGKPDPEVTRLDQILHTDFEPLAKAREALDARLFSVVAGLSSDRLAGSLEYANIAGEKQSTPLALVLGHLFNHQTHHRGQVHNLLSDTSVAPPPLDLIYFLRNPA